MLQVAQHLAQQFGNPKVLKSTMIKMPAAEASWIKKSSLKR